MTTGHEMARNLFAPHGLLQDLREMPTTSVATVAMAFPEESVVQDKEGTGFLVSRSSDYSITACTWTHRKWPTSTPEGKVLIRAYVGRVGDESIVDLPDAEIEKIVLADLGKVMDIKGEPDFTVITRWKKDRPQYGWVTNSELYGTRGTEVEVSACEVSGCILRRCRVTRLH